MSTNEDINELTEKYEKKDNNKKNKTIVVFKKGKKSFQHAHVVVPLTLMTGDFSGSTQTQTRFSPKSTFVKKKMMATTKSSRNESPSVATLKSTSKKELSRFTPEQQFVL